MTGDAFADNISVPDGSGRTGNILGQVNVDTGKILGAFRPRPDGVGMEYCDCHPDMGNALVGFAVPRWADVVNLTQRAAQQFLPISTIGWDVAITPKAVVLIEANEEYQHAGIGQGVLRVRDRLERSAKASDEESARRSRDPVIREADSDVQAR